MNLDETLAGIEACTNLEELRNYLQGIAENFGFVSFNFVDVGQPHLDTTFYYGTVKEAWAEDYARNNFIVVDPCILRVRKTNTPFTWGSIELPSFNGRRKPGAIKTMEAARDHGFTDGLVIPYHFRDYMGRMYSSLGTFFWEDSTAKFKFMLSERRHELHLIMIYWVQRAVDIIAEQQRTGVSIIRPPQEGIITPGLTDRERDMLAWAARGKTVADTADILKISEETVETHIRNAMRKLDASNKTHAVAKAIYLSLIDV
ncbi:helix-turn-helix transcriptional regulator [Microvirga pudoricolor]|uniref:helix-turn-helix transcriptional regulator n=1 Tax=Microvirga pudoricolor TaxID=2778729 RepID=UPI0019516280|nr:LuxR family transcriptional regulator [Microvirga pudoricolor]MBM6594591.1 autoinducer binding domain-containing protein [Microvirga pudoricolor]